MSASPVILHMLYIQIYTDQTNASLPPEDPSSGKLRRRPLCLPLEMDVGMLGLNGRHPKTVLHKNVLCVPPRVNNCNYRINPKWTRLWRRNERCHFCGRMRIASHGEEAAVALTEVINYIREAESRPRSDHAEDGNISWYRKQKPSSLYI